MGDGLTERLLTARELAEVLGLSPATVLDRFEAGDLPGFRLFGRKGGPVRFRESEIYDALEGWRFGRALERSTFADDRVRPMKGATK